MDGSKKLLSMWVGLCGSGSGVGRHLGLRLPQEQLVGLHHCEVLDRLAVDEVTAENKHRFG